MVRRVRGDDLRAVRADVAAMRAEIAELRGVVHQMNHILGGLNHDVRSGVEGSLPLFLGYAERFRTDADTVVGATAVIDRQLQRIAEHVERLADPASADG
jgi:hypothetical protein